jgi:SHAQKYF class myb-like DNA-binding protein
MSQQEKGSHGKPSLSDPDCSVPLDETDVVMASVHVTSSQLEPQPESPPIIDTEFTRRMVQHQLEEPSSLEMDAADGVAVTEQPEKKGRWTRAEHDAFLRGMVLYGREWKRVAQSIPTRTATQVRSHAQKYFQCLERQQKQSSYLAPSVAENLSWNDTDTDSVASSSNMMMTSPSHRRALHSPPDTASMSDSVRQEAERILANPSAVHEEVNATLLQLRQRYEQLNDRWMQIRQQSPSSSNSSAVPTPIHDEQDELIAVQALQSRLRQSLPSSYTHPSSNNDEDELNDHHPADEANDRKSP